METSPVWMLSTQPKKVKAGRRKTVYVKCRRRIALGDPAEDVLR